MAIEDYVLTSKIVDEIQQKENLGKKISRHEVLWFQNNRQVRKPYLTFAMTDAELDEYIKCKLDIKYFTERYCQIKREDGTVGPMTLRDYQKDIIDLYMNNPRSILMASRQTGKCNSFIVNVLVVSEDGNRQIKIPIGLLYYNELKKERKLKLIERIKIKLYMILYRLQ